MKNPLRGIYLNERYYNYISDSFNQTLPLRNTAENTQVGRNFTVNGGASVIDFSISIALENETSIAYGTSTVGVTTWLGVSRLSDLQDYITATGVSMPVIFVTPYGKTYYVVPTGDVAISEYVPTPQEDGMEFRVDLTLQVV